MKIYSKIQPDKLLHIVHEVGKISQIREDVSPANEFMQMAAFELPFGKTFKAHKHNEYKSNEVRIPQESWVILQGSVQCYFYDLDGSLLAMPILYAGDCSITYYGGHNYMSLENGTLVREFKTGAYLGQQHDKTFI